MLGLDVTDWSGAVFPPPPRGKTVRSPFAEDTIRFELSTHNFMINFVVDDLDAMLARVTAEGVAVLNQQTMDKVGRFAWIIAPSGTNVELSEPP